MKLRDRAQLIQQYSHVVATFIRISEPKPGSRLWADAQSQLILEDLAAQKKIPLRFLSAMLLYDGANYAHACHLSHMERAINEIDAHLSEWISQNLTGTAAEVEKQLDLTPAKGSVAIDIRTLVPKAHLSKVQYGIRLLANDGHASLTVAEAIKHANPEMVRQLGLAVKDAYAKASPASVMTGQPSN